MELLPNVLISIPSIGMYIQPESWLKSAISIVLTVRLLLLNMQDLPENNTSPVALSPKLQDSSHPATDF